MTCTATLVRPVSVARDWLHAAGPLACLLCRLFAPGLVDGAVTLVFAGYGTALLLALRQPAELPRVLIGAGAWPVRLWRGSV